MTNYTDEELGAIVEGARERDEWKLHVYNHGAIPHCYILNGGGHSVARVETVGNIQFILDAIRALPILWSQLQEAKAEIARRKYEDKQDG